MLTSPVLTTNEQLVASIVHITIRRDPTPELVVEPDLVNVFYTHDRSRGDEMKPHRLIWEAIGRLPGETVTIRLSRVTRPKGLDLSHSSLRDALREKSSKTHTHTWVIDDGQNAVETGPICMPTDENGRIDIKYDVALTTPGGGMYELDPGINLIPDP